MLLSRRLVTSFGFSFFALELLCNLTPNYFPPPWQIIAQLVRNRAPKALLVKQVKSERFTGGIDVGRFQKCWSCISLKGIALQFVPEYIYTYAWYCTCLLPKSFPRLMCAQWTLGTARHMEDNFGLDFLPRNFHISCFDFSAYFKCGLAHVDIYFQTGICSANCILLSLLVISSGQSCVPNQSFRHCIYGGQLWSDFCAGHFVAGFSLGGWQGGGR